MFVIFFLSTKILKHSDRSFFSVTEGSKVIPCSSSSSVAKLFLSILCLVNDKPSWFGGRLGFSLGVILSSLLSASIAQRWGFSQPFLLSRSHSSQWHEYIGVCGPLS